MFGLAVLIINGCSIIKQEINDCQINPATIPSIKWDNKLDGGQLKLICSLWE